MIKDLGKRLKELRAEKGVFQKDVASAVHVAQNTIAGYETGSKEPSLEVLVLLCKFYNTSSDYLLGLKDYD